MSDQNKSPQDPLTVFSNLPDVRARIKQAGIQVRLRDQEIALEQAEELLADSAERLALVSAQHKRELALVLKATSVTPVAIVAAGAAPHVPPPLPPAPASPMFSEAVADYARVKLAQGKWTEKTEEENAAVYRLFTRIVGDKPIAEIDDEAIVSYLETLKKLPANMNKSPLFVCKGTAEILVLGATPMAARSVNKNIERISSVFKWTLSKKKYGVTRNPASGMSVSESSASKRQPFTAQELAALFSGKEFMSKKFENSHAYWLMPLGLLTGARLGELCQLYVKDFVEHNGVHCIEISDEEEGQHVKNRNAKRLVPIHDKLIDTWPIAIRRSSPPRWRGAPIS
jgi:site-specific recombinase XerD